MRSRPTRRVQHPIYKKKAGKKKERKKKREEEGEGGEKKRKKSVTNAQFRLPSRYFGPFHRFSKKNWLTNGFDRSNPISEIPIRVMGSVVSNDNSMPVFA